MGKHQVDRDQNSAYLAVFDLCVLAFAVPAVRLERNSSLRDPNAFAWVDAVVVVGEALALGPGCRRSSGRWQLILYRLWRGRFSVSGEDN